MTSPTAVRQPLAAGAAPPASGRLLVLTPAVPWGTAGPARGLAQDGPPAVVVGGWRQLLGGIALLVPLVVRRARPGLLRLASRPPVLPAAAATGAYQVLFLHAVSAIGAGLATAARWAWRRSRPGSARGCGSATGQTDFGL